MTAIDRVKVKWTRRLKELEFSGKTTMLCLTIIILVVVISQIT